MDSSDSPKLSLEDVLRFTVDDIRNKDPRSIKIWHLPRSELQSCLGIIRQENQKNTAFLNTVMLTGVYYSRFSTLEARREEMARTLGVDAKELAEKLRWVSHVRRATLDHVNILVLYSCISPRREAPSSPPTPARTPSLYTPTPAPRSPATILALEPVREREAYEALIREGGQPWHPIKPGFNILDKPEECKDIISYWKKRAFGGRLPFSGQLSEWRQFRTWQEDMRQQYVPPQYTFSDYQRVVNDRRQKHNVEGDANLRPDRSEQSALDDWLEYQNYHLHSLEILEISFKNAEEVLDAAKRKSGEVGDLGVEDALEQEDSESSPDLWFPQQMVLLARRKREAAERAARLLEDPSKPAEFNNALATLPMFRLKEWEKKENKFSLIVATQIFTKIKRDLERERILLDWIEKQRPIIASRRKTSHHDTEVIQNQGPAEEADSLNDADSSLLPYSGSPKVTGQKKQHPVLLSCHESEVSKPISRKRVLSPPADSISPKVNESAETPISMIRRRSKRIARLKENMQACISETSALHPLDQAGSGLSKTTKNASRVKRSTNLHTNPNSRDYRLRKNKNDGANNEPAARVPLRRSIRVSKKPERFCAG